ncbi:hypothetical protein LDENG_00151470 [Lucifuga dentata]|nr:hypothetical protein LDENG_00151470 [Lucifuga dentata]
MAPLTSPPGCVNCSHLADQVAELQRRISKLYPIREAEKQMDTIIFGPAQTDTTCDTTQLLLLLLLLRSTFLVPPLLVRFQMLAPPRSTSLMNPGSSLGLNLKPWSALLHLTMSTGAWSTLAAGEGGALLVCLLAMTSSWNIKTNMTSSTCRTFLLWLRIPRLLLHLPPIPPTARPERSSRRARRSTLQFTPAPQEAPVPLTVRSSSPHYPSSQVRFSPPSTPPPTTLVIGDSIVRNIKKKSAATLSFPGAKVSNIMEKIPSILADHPLTKNVVLHVGCNDIPSQTSETLKSDFTKLLDSLKGSLCLVRFLLLTAAWVALAGHLVFTPG